ncbi:DUF6227 family protein [Streptomyces griseocarneus]|uniref:DUF6227 family protein n=1 Tax=Streptomyces griseocarneus TaxID=51201 RepID=UPI0019C7BBF9|nr:DUF6227 family protein [Streptomyces griseocarneus]MBZ6477820.1 DUF6227 family protein [Streptomyces griseocarneus]GHG58204.1 hypothetical protein GCM10018779_23580 [Streptomyces griseocarneus]
MAQTRAGGGEGESRGGCGEPGGPGRGPRGGACEPTPAEQVEELLKRAQNGFEIAERVLERLGTALMHQAELRSYRQRNDESRPLRCNTYRHIFLLADGSSLLLYELEHDTGPQECFLYELYADENALDAAEARVHDRIGGGGIGPGSEAEELPAWLAEELLLAMGPTRPRREYVSEASPDHARRLLRRAENTDGPGEVVRDLLRGALGHHIALITKPRRRGAGRDTTWCRFYEHAFLLEGGGEVSLWELEHNMTADGRLVCEVYLDEAEAEVAADRHARAQGVEL